mmetsp:Transcript_29313/g.49424  ORF Transcript_29313/g.49424 Transcript_29313/m.49424 type:complete len:212 (-) Transcript_29313:223-858(-)
MVQNVESSLKHMAAHGHDLKHKHTDSKAPPAPAAGGEDSRTVEFDEAFVEIQKYFKENKHSKVPQAVIVTLPDGTSFRLGKWVQRQRQLYKNTYTTPGAREGFGQITDSQRDKLATVQFLFDPTPLPKPMDWDHAFKELSGFKQKHGNTKPPEKTMFDDGQGGSADLGKWSQRQRQLYKNTFVTPGERKGFGKLTDDRKAKLESIGFNWGE